jgi:hypothetical protein
MHQRRKIRLSLLICIPYNVSTRLLVLVVTSIVVHRPYRRHRQLLP